MENEPTQFKLADLGLEQVWDEQDIDERGGYKLLTFVKPGELGTTAFLELTAECSADGGIDAGWRVTVNEPQGEEAYSNSFGDSLAAALRWMNEALADMAAFVRARDEGEGEGET